MKLGAKATLEMLKTRFSKRMLGSKTVLGVDISDRRINLALLKKGKNGIELLKAASGPVPDGAIKDGNVEEPAILSKAIRELKSRNKIRTRQAVVSLVAKPVLMQMMDVPKQVPTRMSKFVQNEVRRCVFLSGKEAALDFYKVGSAKRLTDTRVFIVATDGQKVAELTRACSQAGLSVDAIEPPLLAYTRAFYDKKIATKFDCNVLLAIVRCGVLTLCAFKKQTIDFVRTKDIGKEEISPDELCTWLAEQINMVIKFYDVEVPDSAGKWEITVIADSGQLPDGAEETLKDKTAESNLQVRTAEDACQDTFVGPGSGSVCSSAAAIGLAMKPLVVDGSKLRVNLLPPEAAEVKAVKKHALITANIVAAVLLLMILVSGVLALVIKSVNENIAYKKQAHLLKGTNTLLRKQESIEKQIVQLSGAPGRLNSILSLSHDVDWVRILDDVKGATPKTVQITNLSSKDSSSMRLEGLAVSYEAVRLFVDMLDNSKNIESASLINAEKRSAGDRLVGYSINCFLTSEGKDS